MVDRKMDGNYPLDSKRYATELAATKAFCEESIACFFSHSPEALSRMRSGHVTEHDDIKLVAHGLGLVIIVHYHLQQEIEADSYEAKDSNAIIHLLGTKTKHGHEHFDLLVEALQVDVNLERAQIVATSSRKPTPSFLQANIIFISM